MRNRYFGLVKVYTFLIRMRIKFVGVGASVIVLCQFLLFLYLYHNDKVNLESVTVSFRRNTPETSDSVSSLMNLSLSAVAPCTWEIYD